MYGRLKQGFSMVISMGLLLPSLPQHFLEAMTLLLPNRKKRVKKIHKSQFLMEAL